MVDHPDRLDVTGSARGPIWALAGRSASGETAVLLANESNRAVSWGLQCPAGAALPVRTESIRDAATAVEAGTQPDCSGTLAAYEVRLLTVGRGGTDQG